MGRSVYRPYHSFAVFTDRCSNECVFDKVVCESFSKKRVSTQKVGQHFIITDHTITEEGRRGGRRRGEERRGVERRGGGRRGRRGEEGRGEERRGGEGREEGEDRRRRETIDKRERK